MKSQVVILSLVLLAAPVLAHASCDAVKASIDAKIKANGVGDYTLAVVPASDSAGDGKVVGQCEGDKQIVYTRGAAAAATPAADKPAAKAGETHATGTAAKKGAEPQPAASASSGG